MKLKPKSVGISFLVGKMIVTQESGSLEEKKQWFYFIGFVNWMTNFNPEEDKKHKFWII